MGSKFRVTPQRYKKNCFEFTVPKCHYAVTIERYSTV